jgi:hypothetical protein
VKITHKALYAVVCSPYPIGMLPISYWYAPHILLVCSIRDIGTIISLRMNQPAYGALRGFHALIKALDTAYIIHYIRAMKNSLCSRDEKTGKLRRSYRKWSSMTRRCNDPKHPAFYRYGGRAIKVCIRWSGPNGYANFLADMGEPPEGLTLDRIDNDGGYEPTNCRWATWKEQAASRAPRPQVFGSLRQKARAAGLPYHVVYQRVKILGWTELIALDTPVQPRGRYASRVTVLRQLLADPEIRATVLAPPAVC